MSLGRPTLNPRAFAEPHRRRVPDTRPGLTPGYEPGTGTQPLPFAYSSGGVMTLPGVADRRPDADGPGTGMTLEAAGRGVVAGEYLSAVDPLVLSTAIQSGSQVAVEVVRAVPRRAPVPVHKRKPKPKHRAFVLRDPAEPAGAKSPSWKSVALWGAVGVAGGLVAGKLWKGKA